MGGCGRLEETYPTSSRELCSCILDPFEGPKSSRRIASEQTVRLPSDTFLWAALGSIGLSLTLQMMGKQQMSTFVGQWAPTILIMGLYHKLVKVHGSE
jgi:hypothetical protein